MYQILGLPGAHAKFLLASSVLSSDWLGVASVGNECDDMRPLDLSQRQMDDKDETAAFIQTDSVFRSSSVNSPKQSQTKKHPKLLGRNDGGNHTANK